MSNRFDTYQNQEKLHKVKESQLNNISNSPTHIEKLRWEIRNMQMSESLGKEISWVLLKKNQNNQKDFKKSIGRCPLNQVVKEREIKEEYRLRNRIKRKKTQVQMKRDVQQVKISSKVAKIQLKVQNSRPILSSKKENVSDNISQSNETSNFLAKNDVASEKFFKKIQAGSPNQINGGSIQNEENQLQGQPQQQQLTKLGIDSRKKNNYIDNFQSQKQFGARQRSTSPSTLKKQQLRVASANKANIVFQKKSDLNTSQQSDVWKRRDNINDNESDQRCKTNPADDESIREDMNEKMGSFPSSQILFQENLKLPRIERNTKETTLYNQLREVNKKNALELPQIILSIKQNINSCENLFQNRLKERAAGSKNEMAQDKLEQMPQKQQQQGGAGSQKKPWRIREAPLSAQMRRAPTKQEQSPSPTGNAQNKMFNWIKQSQQEQNSPQEKISNPSVQSRRDSVVSARQSQQMKQQQQSMPQTNAPQTQTRARIKSEYNAMKQEIDKVPISKGNNNNKKILEQESASKVQVETEQQRQVMMSPKQDGGSTRNPRGALDVLDNALSQRLQDKEKRSVSVQLDKELSKLNSMSVKSQNAREEQIKIQHDLINFNLKMKLNKMKPVEVVLENYLEEQ